MKLQIFGITKRSTLESLPLQELRRDWVDDETHRWIDVEAAMPDELRNVLAPMRLPDSILDACLNEERSSRFISRQNELYLEVPTHLGWNESWKPYMSVLCLQSTLITIHRDIVHSIDDVIDDLDDEVPLFEQSTSALLYHLLTEIGRRNLEAALDVRTMADELGHSLRKDPDQIDPQELTALQHQVSHYSTVYDDHTYCAGVLRTVESKILRTSEGLSFFNDMLQLAEVSRQLINGTRSRVMDLQRMYEAAVQERVESRLRLLTILSAIFLPLTLISGIYGMNFDDLPGMGPGNGYMVVLGVMVATVVLMGLYLYRKGWFQ